MRNPVWNTSACVLTHICPIIDLYACQHAYDKHSGPKLWCVRANTSNSPYNGWSTGGCCGGSGHITTCVPACISAASNHGACSQRVPACKHATTSSRTQTFHPYPPLLALHLSPCPALMLLCGRIMIHCFRSEGPRLSQPCCCTGRGDIRKPYLPIYGRTTPKCFKICI